MTDRTPVSTLEELKTLDPEEMIEGFSDGYRLEPAPGDNRSKSYWHGYRNAMIDKGIWPRDWASGELAGAYVKAQRAKEPNGTRKELS